MSPRPTGQKASSIQFLHEEASKKYSRQNVWGRKKNPGKVWGAGAGKALENLAEMILSTGDSDSAAEYPLYLGHEHWLVPGSGATPSLAH